MSEQERTQLAMLEKVNKSHVLIIDALLSQAEAIGAIVKLQLQQQQAENYAGHPKVVKLAQGR